jgi:N-carbamoyl-L-amino-acid hydrolase
LSDADLAARGWFRQTTAESGFQLREDGIGNLSAILPAADPTAPTVMCGSHLDTVPQGGRFDGALGVVAALEVLRIVKQAGATLPVHLEAVSFTDEEGTWAGLLGSRAMAGQLDDEALDNVRGGREPFAAALAQAGYSRESALNAHRDPRSIKAWVEVHIEQGTRLEEAGQSIGVVTGIVGIMSYWLTFVGRADHAGTTPMDRRQDALRGVTSFLQQCRELVMNRFPLGVVNSGIVEVRPGAFNIVPERARLALEFRHSDPGKLDAMREALLNLALNVVEVEGLKLDVEQAGSHQPEPMHRDVIEAIEGACGLLGLQSTRMASYAGHDTQSLAHITRAGMFFVPSVGGASHSYREFTPEQDCVNAGNVLLQAVLSLAMG